MPKGFYERVIRPISIVGEIAYVPLTKGYTATIDAEDVYKVDGYNWFPQEFSNTVYAIRNCPREKGKPRKNVKLHTVIMEYPENYIVDHRDGDGLNNRKENLRLANSQQNAWNSRKPITNTSGYKGVSWRKDKYKWQATIKTQRKTKHLGYFNNKEDAAAAYAEASVLYHGNFGRLD